MSTSPPTPPEPSDRAAGAGRGRYDSDGPQRREQQVERTRNALNARQDQLRRPSVRIHPDNDPARAQFLYVEQVLTTRTTDRGDVLERLPDLVPSGVTWSAADGEPIQGVTTITFDGGEVDVTAVCRGLDSLRPGVAMPMGVVHITPTGTCPATEAVPTSGRPVPPPTTDQTAGTGVSVVVIDTGRRHDVERQHPWLHLPDITGDLEDHNDVGHYRGHGTFVCGVVRSMAPQTTIDVNGVLITLGAVVEADLAVELWKAATNDRPQVVSMSAGTTARDGYPPIALAVAVEKLTSEGILLVAAAGNDGTEEPFYPAAFSVADPRLDRPANDHVVSVGAVDTSEHLATFSNHGWPVVYAVGCDVGNAYPRGRYQYQEIPLAPGWADFPQGMATWSGTSFSTPLVSGMVAAQMTKAGVGAKQAWDTLFSRAQQHPAPGAGPVLRPRDVG